MVKAECGQAILKLSKCFEEPTVSLTFRCEDGNKSHVSSSGCMSSRKRANRTSLRATFINCNDAIRIKRERPHGK